MNPVTMRFPLTTDTSGGRPCQLLLAMLLLMGTALLNVSPVDCATDDDFEVAPADADFLLPVEEQKRAGGRAFLPSVAFDPAVDKRWGDQMSYAEDGDKRGGARAFQQKAKRGGARGFFFNPDEKRGGARPFFGGFIGGEPWKRAGGRFFARPFFDDRGFNGGSASWMKRGGARQFSMLKRGGGRSFFGGVDALFNPANYWGPPQPLNKYSRRSPADYSPLSSMYTTAGDSQLSPLFYAGSHSLNGQDSQKRAGARAFAGNDDNNNGILIEGWEKRAGGRNFDRKEN